MHAFLSNLAHRQTNKRTRANAFTSSFVGGKKTGLCTLSQSHLILFVNVKTNVRRTDRDGDTLCYKRRRDAIEWTVVQPAPAFSFSSFH